MSPRRALRLAALAGLAGLGLAAVPRPEPAPAAHDPAAWYAREVPAAVTAGLPFAMPRVSPPRFPDRWFSIADFGAIPGGQVSNTAAFAAAIAACVKAGGGHVLVPRGLWLTGPIRLESRLDLHLARGALVVFSPRFEDYPLVRYPPGGRGFRCVSPLYGEGLEDVAITGSGLFDGSGDAWRYVKKEKLTAAEWSALVRSGGVLNPAGTEWWPSQGALDGERYLARLRERTKDPTAQDFLPAREFLRPDLVSLVGCRNVLLDGPTFRNSPRFNLHPIECERLIVRDVTVLNAWNAQNGDGIDIGSSHDVIVYDVTVDVGDDGICLKPGPVRTRRDWAYACENVVIADSTVYRAHGGFVIGSETNGGARRVAVRNLSFVDTDVGLRFKTNRSRGGAVEDVSVSGVSMRNVAREAILFDPYYGGNSPDERPARERDERKAEPVTATTPRFSRFSIRDVACVGARRAIVALGLPESPLREITFEDVRIRSDEGAVLQDVDGLTLSGFDLRPARGPVFSLRASRNVTLRRGRAPQGVPVFLSVLDAETQGVRVLETDLAGVATPVRLAPGARPDAVERR